MDDFEGELYEDYDDDEQIDVGNDISIDDIIDDARDIHDGVKKIKNNNSTNTPTKDVSKNAAKDTAKQGSKDIAKQGGKEATKQVGKETAKQAGKETGKQVAKHAGKEAAKVAAEGAAASTGVGLVVAAGIEVADKLNELKKKVDEKNDAKIEEATGIKNFSKKKKFIPILLIISIIIMIFVLPAMAMYSVSETATSELTTLVRTREEYNKKELILFTKSELKKLLKTDINVEATIANKLAEEGYTLEANTDGKYKSPSYKTILESYGSDLTNTFMSNDLTNATVGTEDVLEDGQTYDSLEDKEKDLTISVNNVKKYLMAEIDNFNDGVKWQTTELKTNYLNLKSDEFEDYYDFANQPDKLKSDGTHDLIDKSITNKNYTIEDDDGNNTMLKIPRLKQYGVNVELSGGENEAAREFVDMLGPYMQKWIIPYTIYIDTQDDEFVNNIMEYMYHPAEVSIFQLQKLVKTVKYEYYMMCYQYEQQKYCESDGETTYCWWETIPGTTVRGLNTKDNPIGTKSLGGGRRLVTKIEKPYVIARDSNGNPLTKKIYVERELDDADSSAELTYLGSFYEETRKTYNILPIDENNLADTSTTGALTANERTGIGYQTIVDEWNETLVMEKYETEKYKVSYYDDDDYEDLGRDISRIEWYQDVMGASLGGLNVSGAFGAGTNKFEKAYNGAYKESLERIWDGIVSWGYTEEQAAAIIGNIAQESSFNVTAVNSIGATGLCQWLGGRRNMLYSFASSRGTAWNDLTTQLQFLCMEVAWNERYSYTSYQWGGHGQALNAFKTGTVEQATVGFRKGFERCGEEEANDAVRIACARSAYETFSGRTIQYPIEKIAASSTSSDTSISTNGGLGAGETAYSYDDMYFAYHQIEQWYQKTGLTLNSNSITSVALPGGGFAWPVDISGNTGARKINKLYSVDGIDGIQISTGNVWSFDGDENLYKGADVLATHSGKVLVIQPVENSSTYAYIEIQTDDGDYKTHYGNLSEITVAVGDTVTKGQKIGKIGNTGSGASGAAIYLTYKMYYNGSKVDPLQYYNVKDSSGNKVDNYDEIDKNSVPAGAYSYDSSKQYLGGEASAVEGDIASGIHYYFTSSSGRTYACYLQNKGPWKNLRYASKTIYEWGCAVTSVATIMSGYGFTEITPATYAGDMPSIIGIVQAKLPKSKKYTPSGATNTRNKIVEHLQNGNGVIIHCVTGNKYAPGGTHWMALLDVRQGTSGIEVFVADPWHGNQPEGWRSLDVMLVSLSSYILIES